MAAQWHWYGPALNHIVKADIDFDTATFKVMLTTSAYTPDLDHEFRSSVTNEVGASGTYAAGGGALGTTTVAYDSANNRVNITWADVAFTGATITARTAVIYNSRGGAATADELIAYASETGDVTSTNGTFTVDLPPTPVLTITTS
jgi:hypothetical protein